MSRPFDLEQDKDTFFPFHLTQPVCLFVFQRIKYLLSVCKIDRPVPQYNEETRQNDYIPLHSVGRSKLARKTHVDMLNKVQIDLYASGLHKAGSTAVRRYTAMELKDRFALMNAAFDQSPYKVNKKLEVI